MSFHVHAEMFVGKKVVAYDAETGASEPAGSCIYRIGGLEYGDEQNKFTESFARFVSDPKAIPIVGVVIGAWNYDEMLESSARIVQELIAAAAQLPHLRAIFFGDITYQECEISWINQSDMTPLLNAYPDLQHFRVRGANRLRFQKLKHAQLISLSVESGGLHIDPLTDIVGAKLPKLEHLELWLGDSGYGAVEPGVLIPLLTGKQFPKLTYLGLRNYRRIDELCPLLAKSKLLDRIRVLDLSNGNISDEGLDALLVASAKLKKLERLDLHHHYLSNEGIERVQALGIPVDVSEQLQGDGEDRYIVASE